MTSSSVTVHGLIAPAHCDVAAAAAAEAGSVESADFAADADAAADAAAAAWCRSEMDHIIDVLTLPVDSPSLD